MNEDLKKAIKELAKKSSATEKPGDAMQFAQAALNLAHVAATPTKPVKPACEEGQTLSGGHCCARGLVWQGGRCDAATAASPAFIERW